MFIGSKKVWIKWLGFSRLQVYCLLFSHNQLHSSIIFPREQHNAGLKHNPRMSLSRSCNFKQSKKFTTQNKSSRVNILGWRFFACIFKALLQMFYSQEKRLRGFDLNMIKTPLHDGLVEGPHWNFAKWITLWLEDEHNKWDVGQGFVGYHPF